MCDGISKKDNMKETAILNNYRRVINTMDIDGRYPNEILTLWIINVKPHLKKKRHLIIYNPHNTVRITIYEDSIVVVTQI